MTFRALVTCPPMLGMLDDFMAFAQELGIELVSAKTTQILSENELIELLPSFDGWIIGDDPATDKVFQVAHSGKLRAAVKWGIGVDNVDFASCKRLGIPICNIPGMFGAEVADIALGYVIALARQTFEIDRAVRDGQWIKPRGMSLSGRSVAVIGYGDIGRNTAKRLLACDMKVTIYDPYCKPQSVPDGIRFATWPEYLDEADFIVVNCSLSDSSYHLLDQHAFRCMKKGVRIVNVGRGPIIDEKALIEALQNEQVYSAALDVFEQEPLPIDTPLRSFPRCIFGSHNASNTADGVERTSIKAIQILSDYLHGL